MNAYPPKRRRDDGYIVSSTGDGCGLEIAVDVGNVRDVSLVREREANRTPKGRVSYLDYCGGNSLAARSPDSSLIWEALAGEKCKMRLLFLLRLT
jgi:hypothetical protein